MPTVSAHVAVTLAAHVDHVFGVMGNGNAYFLDALTCQTDARFIPVRHEAGAVVAADAFHRASGRLAAATTTYGAGFTNTLTALAEAVQAHVPLVLVVGDEPTSGPRPWDVDQIAMASAVGARTYTVGRTDAAATTVIAVEHALTYRVPTVLAIPYDVATLDTGPVPETPTPRLPAPLAVRGAFADGVVREIAAALAGRAPAAAPRRARRLGGRRGRGARRHRRRHRCADGDDGARARGLPPDRVRPRRRRRVRRRRTRWRSSARPTSRSSSAPRSTSSRCGSATSSRPGAGSSRSTSHPRRPTRTSAGTCAGTPPSSRRRSSASSQGAAQRVARVRRPHGRATARARGRDRRGRAARPALRRGPPRRAAARGPRGRLGRRALPRLVEHVLAGDRAGPDGDGRHRVPGDRARLPQRGGGGARPARGHGGPDDRRRRRAHGPVRPRVGGAGRGRPRDRGRVERRGVQRGDAPLRAQGSGPGADAHPGRRLRRRGHRARRAGRRRPVGRGPRRADGVARPTGGRTPVPAPRPADLR